MDGAAAAAAARPAGDHPAADRSVDDTDTGWGDPLAAPGADPEADRLLRERPPHWG